MNGDAALVGEGFSDEGIRWELRAGGTKEDFATLVSAWDNQGPLGERGMAGPLLPHDHLVCLYTGGGDRGPRYVVARTDSSVSTLELKHDRGRKSDVPLFTVPALRGIRFGVAFIDRDVPVRAVVAHDEGGRVVDRLDVTEQQRVWDRFRLIAPKS